NGMMYKPNLFLLVNRARNTTLTTSTQKPLDVSEGDRPYRCIRKRQQNACFAKRFLLAPGQMPEFTQAAHLSPAIIPPRPAPQERTWSAPRRSTDRYDSY